MTTRNDRRLVTTSGLWVRNGDRWHVDVRRDDGALVVSHLHGHGRVVLPADYVTEHVALAYAVTVHKAEGLTVDCAVLLADSATRAEHLYVGMTRGRHDNQVCVVNDAATTGHGHQRPPTPTEILADALHRSSAERSATETLRDTLDRGEDRETLRRLHDQAVAYIETNAGPDRRPELRHLWQLQTALPAMRDAVATNEHRIAPLDDHIGRIQTHLADDETRFEALHRRRLFRRPDHGAIDQTQWQIDNQRRYLERLDKDRARAATELERNRSRLRNAERDVGRIPDVETAIEHRRDWIVTHPAEIAWEADLAARLADASRTTDPPAAEREHNVSDLDDLLRSIDLRTMDLAPGRRTGIERATDDALGISRVDDLIDRLRPPPGRGADGPDLGLGW